MKKIIVVCLMLCLVAPIAMEAKKKSFGYGLYWEVTKQGELIISGNGVIPNYKYPHYKKFKTNGTAPWNQKKVWDKVYKVIIEEGITEVGDNAFNGRTYYRKNGLTHIREFILPSSVTKIGNYAFAFSSITSLTFPSKIGTIGQSIFNGCRNIRDFTIPSNWTVVTSGLFKGCNNLTQVTIPEGVKTIGSEAFYGCASLNNITLPKSLKRIDRAAFSETALKSIFLPDNVEQIGKSAFYNCDGLSSITFSSNLNTIGESAFYSCDKITRINLPLNLVTIEKNAFSNCDLLQHVSMYDKVKTIGEKAFYRTPKLADIKLSSNASIGKNVVGAEAYLRSDRYKFEGIIYGLPSDITKYNCDEYGISRSAFDKYANGENGIINSQGKMILEAKSGRKAERKTDDYDNSVYYEITDGDGHGVLDDNGKWIVPIESGRKIVRNHSGKNGFAYYIISDKTGKGIIDSRGNTLIPTTRGYTYIGNYDSSKGTFAFTKKGYTGFCDAHGREVSISKLAPTLDEIKSNGGYASASEIKNGSTKYYIVGKNGRYGLTDVNGRVIIPVELESLGAAGDGFLRFKNGGFYGIMNYQGRTIIDTTRGYTSIGNYLSSRQRFTYEMYGYKGECDNTGKELSKIKVATPQQNVATTTTNTTSNNSSKSNSGSSTTQTIVVEHHHDPIPVQQWQACFACGGMGTMGCDGCGGSGTRYVGDNLRRCFRCNGQGIIPCNICFGNKGQYITVYQ